MINKLTLTVAALLMAFPAVAQETGIPACDSYYAQWEACVRTKFPEARRASQLEVIAKSRDGTRTGVTQTPDMKANFEQHCSTEMQKRADAYKRFGCEFK